MSEQLELPLSYSYRQVATMCAMPPRLEPCNECNPDAWIAFCELTNRPLDLSTPTHWTELDVYMWARTHIVNIDGTKGK